MTTTKTKRRKVSAFSILALITSVLPIVVEFLSSGEPEAHIELSIDDRDRLKAKVSTPDGDRTISKSTVQKPL